VVEKHNKAYR
jgi:hypothetical protein